jgi:DNA polymerase-3 subunit alpha
MCLHDDIIVEAHFFKDYIMSHILRPPDRFVSIHGHSTFSPYDGLGQPHEHIEFCLKNQLDGWTLTDHGNGNGLAHAHAHMKKLSGKGRKFRQIYGVEFYFVPSLKDWRTAYTESKDAKNKKGASDKDAGLVLEDADETRTKAVVSNVNRRYHLVVIAKNEVGLANLFTLVKRSFAEGFFRFPRIDFEMLKQHGEGLAVSTACVGGYPSGLIYDEFAGLKFDQLHPSLVDDPAIMSKCVGKIENACDMFIDAVGRENFFLETQFHAMNAQDLTNRVIIETSKKTGIPMVATADSHFPGPDLWEAREVYRLLMPGRIKDDGTGPKVPLEHELKAKLYPKNAVQMWDEYLLRRQEFSWYEGTEDLVRRSIETGHDIAWQLCNEVWFDTTAKLPRFTNEKKTAFQQLSQLVKDGLIAEGLHEKPEYVERAKMELGDIKYLNFSDYFLTLQKVFKLAENRTLPGAGRGSGAGSLVNYLLGITHVDPVKYGLLFERFLNKQKASWPDIDTDVGDRDELINAAREIFGEDAVVPVSNFNTLKLKSLVKDISKLYQIPFSEVNAVTGPLEAEVSIRAQDPNMEKSMFVLKHEDCMKYSERYQNFMEKYPQVEDKVKKLFMMNRSIGRHAGGVLICPELEKHMPLIKVRGELQTPWTEGVNIRNLEENGFLKFDFLGLSQMKMVEDCIRRILRSQNSKEPQFEEIKKFYDEKLNCRYVEPSDSKVFDHVFKGGNWPGIFQFTSPGARKFCLKAQPNNITDLAAITAIYRPGPLKANVHKLYVKAKRDAENIKYDHPAIKNVLGSTYGFIAFQEQFMLLAQQLAGFSPGDSDKMRKTLVKKDLTSLGKKAKEKEELEKKFVEGCVSVSGLERRKAQELFDKIAFFSLYGFNLSHAVSYAIVSYYGAWLSTYYPKHWLSTVLQAESGSQEKLTKVINEIRKMGYEFAQIDVNYSEKEWAFSDDIDAFVPSLASVKGIGATAVDEILSLRPFTSIDDFLYNEDGKWRLSKINKTCLSALCKIEALSSLKDFEQSDINYNQLLYTFTDENNYVLLKKGRYGKTTTQLKKLVKEEIEPEPIVDVLLQKYANLEDWTRTQKINLQFDLTSSVDPELLFSSKLMNRLGEKNVSSLHKIQSGTAGIGWFCVQDVIQKKTKNGKTFYRIRAIDNEHNATWLRVWGKFENNVPPERFSLWMAHASNDSNWGFSTSVTKLRRIA